ncbi:MAG: CHAT domain-containing protein [Saprospiraceae bacterium]
MVRLVSLVLFTLVYFNINGQKLASQEISKIDSLGHFYLKKTNDIYKQDLDQAVIYADSALFFFQKTQNWENIVLSLIYKSSAYNYNGDYFNFHFTLLEASQLANEYLDEDNPSSISVLSSIAKNEMDIGNYDLAIEFFQKILKIDIASDDKKFIASDLNNLGDIYFRKGDYIEALKHFEESGRIRNEVEKNGWRVAIAKINVADTYQKMNNFLAAKESYTEAVQMLLVLANKANQKNFDFVFRELTNAYLSLGELALKEKNWEEALSNVTKAETYSNKVYVPDQGRSADILSEINKQKGNYKKALEYCFESLELAKEEFKAFGKHPVKAEKILRIANGYSSMGDWEKALQFYLKTLNQVTPDFSSSNAEQNSLPENFYSNLIALDALKGKAECFFQFYKKNKNLSDLKIAYQTYQASLKLIPTLRKSFRQEGSKEILSSKVLPLFEQAIDLALILFNETTDDLYLYDAFQFVEGNKAVLLLESMNENTAINNSDIPDDLKKKELKLSLEINHFEKLKNEEEQKIKPDKNYLENFDKKLFQLNQEYQTLIETLEKEFPKYREFKDKTELVSVEKLQRKLPNTSTVLIEYFVGHEQVYIFTITSNDFKVSQFKKDESFEKSIIDLRNMISQSPTNQDEIKSYQNYITNSQYLFQQLIETSLTDDINSLVIIPDDILGLLPFEILLSESPSESSQSYHLEDLSYLFEQVDISYSYSSTLLANQVAENKSKSNFDFVGFAPSFKKLEGSNASRTCEIGELINLKNSKEEVTRIQAIWGGKIFVDEEANTSSFEKYAAQSDIIHLATHACTDKNNHQFNKIFFTDDYLSNKDLYNFFSQSRLAVLSACNTGSGQLVKGEGVMSLSRGFIHAGCPSVVMSLWSVDDGSTSKIMELFYQNLRNGETKDQALRYAKLEYLRSSKKSFQHPYYWAAFVQFGDARPLCKEGFSFSKKIIIGGVLFLFALFLFQQFRKKS